MFPNFLPSQVNQVTDPKAIAFGQSIERIALATSISQRPIFTTGATQKSEIGVWFSITPLYSQQNLVF
jgi:hypothetical protein